VWLAIFLPLFGLLGLRGEPAQALWQARVLALLLSPAVAVLFSVPYTILADICDLDYKRTGTHREAMYFGFQGTMMKGGWGIAPLIAALVIQVLGIAPPLRLGYHMLGPIAGAMALAGFVIFRFYPEKRIQAELQESKDSSGIP
jgi:Na+/melibiose symporter-like transporter